MLKVKQSCADALAKRYCRIRALTEALAKPLSPEDQCIQSMEDASPTKWHLAHTTWFFETMILRNRPDYHPYDEKFDLIFNSYYWGLGVPMRRGDRGLLSRPSLERIIEYRAYVDAEILCVLELGCSPELIELGLQHEQQHQELLLTDIKHAFWMNPLKPAYGTPRETSLNDAAPLNWLDFDGGTVEVGYGEEEFSFDNERPAHKRIIAPFRIASRLITCGEYQQFIDDGGYKNPLHWLSDGWSLVQKEDWCAPLYWQEDGTIFTLQGIRKRAAPEPVIHISFFEAMAYASWAGKRLPTEFEWEVAAKTMPVQGSFLEASGLSPNPANGTNGQFFGDGWEWTSSSYEPYPGFKPFVGVASEYNGKFMVGQMILRGGSCVTPEGHIRPSYRNFFPPAARWQFSAIRLAEDL